MNMQGAGERLLTPTALLREAIAYVPSLRYALGVGGVAAIVSLVLSWKLEPAAAIIGGLTVVCGMAILVVFSALAKESRRSLRPLALTLAWSFLMLTVGVAGLFVSCAFFGVPQTLPCLFGDERCNEGPSPPGAEGAKTVVGAEKQEQPAELYVEQGVVARQVLDLLYQKEFEAVYELFAPVVRTNLPYPVFRATALRQLFQPNGSPLRRRIRDPLLQGNFLTLSFEAEFDEVSTWLEGVTFIKNTSEWQPYRIDVQPLSWLSATGARVLSDASPEDVLERVQRSQDASAVVGAWTPAAGWRLRVETVRTRRGEKTCDVRFTSVDVMVDGRLVLGGCVLSAGTAVDVVGKITNVSAARVELDEVRFQPAETPNSPED